MFMPAHTGASRCNKGPAIVIPGMDMPPVQHRRADELCVDESCAPAVGLEIALRGNRVNNYESNTARVYVRVGGCAGGVRPSTQHRN